MEFEMDGQILELSTAEVREVIDRFLSLVDIREEICEVSVFGGTVRDPDRCHDDIDLMLCVDVLPNEEELLRVATAWHTACKQEPLLRLIDFFLTDDTKVLLVSPHLDYVKEFDITDDKPAVSDGLDDDSTHIYIGDACTLDNIFPSATCKCGGHYKEGGQGWPSRMMCDKCGDYYDL